MSLCSDPGPEDEKGTWGKIETGLCLEGEESLSGERDLGLGKEAGVMGREMEPGLGLDGGVSLG